MGIGTNLNKPRNHFPPNLPNLHIPKPSYPIKWYLYIGGFCVSGDGLYTPPNLKYSPQKIINNA